MINGSTSALELPPLVLDGEPLLLTLNIRDRVLAMVKLLPGPISFVHSVQALVIGETRSGDVMLNQVTLVPWQSIDDIAAWVQGDGTDPQRLALADGIRRGQRDADLTPTDQSGVHGFRSILAPGLRELRFESSSPEGDTKQDRGET